MKDDLGMNVEVVPGPEGPAINRNPTGRRYTNEEVLNELMEKLGCNLTRQIILAEPRMIKMYEPALKHLKRKFNNT